MRLGQHLGESLEKVLCNNHLERIFTSVEVLKISWQQFNIFIKVILQEKRTSIYRKKLGLTLTLPCMTRFLKTLIRE